MPRCDGSSTKKSKQIFSKWIWIQMYCHVLPILPSLVKPILPSKQRKEVAFGWTNNYRPKVQTCFAIDDFYCCKIANKEDKIILNMSTDSLLCSLKIKRLHITDDVWLITDGTCLTIPTSSARRDFCCGVSTLKRCIWPFLVSLQQRKYCVRESEILQLFFFWVRISVTSKTSQSHRNIYVLTGQMRISVEICSITAR